jgi:gamma-aminobutyric acid type B receptor
VYPIPTWSERIYNPQIEPAEWAMFALAIAGSVFSIVLMIYIAINRNNKVIRGSSALFLGYLLFGTLLSYASIFTGNLNAISVGTCVLTPLFLGIGFTITFGSLFAKSWRIHSLYNDKTLTIRAITDTKLTIITAVVVAVEVAICTIIAAFGSEVVLVVTDPHRPSLWYQICNVDMVLSPVAWSFVIIALAYNAVVMAYGVYLAVRIRSVPHKVYNESRQLAFVIYALVVLAALIVALQFVPSINRVEKFVIRSVGIVVANLTTIIVIIGNKLHMMRKLKDNKDESFRSDRSMNMTSVNTNSGDTTKLEQENEDLRKEVEKLKAELSAVKKQQASDNSSEARPEV